MSLILLMCFGTANYYEINQLDQQRWSEGVACVLRVNHCERTGHNRGMSVSSAREACLMAEKNFRNERE